LGRFRSNNPANQIGIELTELTIRTGERQRPYELEFVSKSGERVWALLVNEYACGCQWENHCYYWFLNKHKLNKKNRETLKERWRHS
jgi:hypothetical protein